MAPAVFAGLHPKTPGRRTWEAERRLDGGPPRKLDEAQICLLYTTATQLYDRLAWNFCFLTTIYEDEGRRDDQSLSDP